MIQALRKNISTLIYISLILFAVWMSFVIVYGKGGIVRRRKLEAEIMVLRREILELEKENRMIEVSIESLRDNERYIEGYARELGYRKEGETIYKFIEKGP
jgi:cell division protein FtsB